MPQPPDDDGQPSTAATDSFVPAKRFEGARPGWIFQRGASGVGYYRDEASAADSKDTPRIFVNGKQVAVLPAQPASVPAAAGYAA